MFLLLLYGFCNLLLLFYFELILINWHQLEWNIGELVVFMSDSKHLKIIASCYAMSAASDNGKKSQALLFCWFCQPPSIYSIIHFQFVRNACHLASFLQFLCCLHCHFYACDMQLLAAFYDKTSLSLLIFRHWRCDPLPIWNWDLLLGAL